LNNITKPSEVSNTVDSKLKSDYEILYNNLQILKENYENDLVSCRILTRTLIDNLKQIRNFNEEIQK